MANTTNLNLVKPAGTDYALVSVINGNMDIIDSKVGAIPANESAQSQITALNNQKANIGNLSYGSYTYTSHAAMETGLVNLAATLGASKTTAIYLYPNFGGSMFGGAPGVATIETGSSASFFSVLFHNYVGAFYGKYLNGTWTWGQLALEKTDTASGTTSASGNLSLGLAASAGRVTSAYIASGYIAIPFVTSSTWYVHVMDNSAVAQTSKSVTVEYTYV